MLVEGPELCYWRTTACGCVAVGGILLAGRAVCWTGSCGLQQRLRPRACPLNLSPQSRATNGAAPAFSFINVTAIRLSRALCFTGVCVQHHRLSVSGSRLLPGLSAPVPARSIPRCPREPRTVPAGLREECDIELHKLGWNRRHWPAGERLCILLDILVS